MKILVKTKTGGTATAECESGETILSALVRAGIFISAPCGGTGRCGKCRVKLIDGLVQNETPDAFFLVRACKAVPQGSITVQLTNADAALTDKSKGQSFAAKHGTAQRRVKRLGVALDLGTTTLAAELVDLDSGETLNACGRANPQAAYGADVISRITAAGEGKGGQMQLCIVSAINAMLTELKQGYGVATVEELVVAGNTVMLHLLVGEDPSGLGIAPFTPMFLTEQSLSGKALNLHCARVCLLPGISAFVGADATAGIVACGLDGAAEKTLLIDLGTNGEIVLSQNGQLFATATAAGPALEGAEISCGKGGTVGAIDSVWQSGKGVAYSTVGGAAANGICGSGLTSAVATLLKIGALDKTGRLLPPYEQGITLAPSVTLYQQDIRKFQLAKAAICAGIYALCERAGTPISEVRRVLLAGGLGFYLDPVAAVNTGLLPKAFLGKANSAGNSSLAGARKTLTNADARRAATVAATKCTALDLSTDEAFVQYFVSCMNFL